MSKEFVNTRDGFTNVASRLGMTNDNQMSASYYNSAHRLLTRNRILLENLYRSNWIVARGIDTIAEDMTKKKLEIQCPSQTPDKIQLFLNYMDSFSVFDRVNDGLRWGDLYGGAVALPILKSQQFSDPLDIDKVKKGDFCGIRVYDRWTVFPSVELITDLGPMEGLPHHYDIMDVEGMYIGQSIHWSRAYRFIGVELPHYQRIYERYWGGSVIERWYDRVCFFDSATHGGANLLLKAYLRVYKVDGYRDIMAAGGVAEDNFVKSMYYTRKFETAEGFTTIDKNDEFETFNWSFSGMDAAIHTFAEQLAGALQIPLVRLLGQPPSGFSATGESDQQTYYDGISLRQEKKLRPFFIMLLPIMWKSCFGEELPSDLTFKFPSLWEVSDKSKSEVANMDTDTVVKLFTSNCITQKEMKHMLKKLSPVTGRFEDVDDGEDKYFWELQLDIDKKRQSAGLDVSSADNQQKSKVRLDTSNKQRAHQGGSNKI